MRILLSNDDGYLAPGLNILAAAVSKVATISVIAPERNHSGASSSLTLRVPVRATIGSNGFLFVDGTPADCVHVGLTGLLKEEHSMVIAGINAGANLGDDVLYSGTVAAAFEGRFLGLPAIAVSLVGSQLEHYDTAAQVVVRILTQLKIKPLPDQTILNINVPDVPLENLQGFKPTRLGARKKSGSVVESKDPDGRPVYWVGPSGPADDDGPGTDFHAVRNGYVSISPLTVDMTHQSRLPELNEWLKSLGK